MFFLYDFLIVFSSRELEANIFHSGWLLPYSAKANNVDDQWECIRTVLFFLVFSLFISFNFNFIFFIRFSWKWFASFDIPPFFMFIGNVFAVKITHDFYSKSETKSVVARRLVKVQIKFQKGDCVLVGHFIAIEWAVKLIISIEFTFNSFY